MEKQAKLSARRRGSVSADGVKGVCTNTAKRYNQAKEAKASLYYLQ